MTTELTYLLLTALLAASLWIPFIVGVNATPAREVADFHRPPDIRQMPAWVHRAYRAHQNLLEQMMPFAVIVLVAHVLGVSTTATVWSSVAFFWLRIAHAVGMITGAAQFPARPIIFTAGWICIVVIGWQVFLHAG